LCQSRAKEWGGAGGPRCISWAFNSTRNPATHSGPLISPQARERVIELTGSVEAQGGRILLDGRAFRSAQYPHGNFVGPSVVEAYPGMRAYDEEIFGPTLVVLKADSLEEATQIINKNKYGEDPTPLAPLVGALYGKWRCGVS
jgi:acyl-CoA reductase-like NAD-dependent aldehyde dehydrogenase